MLAPPASVWVTHEDADRSRPFHADYGVLDRMLIFGCRQLRSVLAE
jgi:hypothetical protein